MIRFSSVLGLGLVAVVAFSQSCNAAVVVIDDFDTGDFSTTATLNVTTPTATQGPLPPTSVIGGFRDDSVTNGAGGLMEPGTVSMAVGSGSLTFGASFTPGSGVITYDGAGVPGAGFAPVDVTSGGTNNGFVLAVTGLAGPVTVVIDVTTGMGTSTQSLMPVTIGNLFFSFAGFSGTAGPLTGVTKVKLTVGTGNAAGAIAAFSSFTAAPVPEPASLALIGMALLPLGVGAMRRRSRKLTTAA